MKVMKFGGTSVGTAERIQAVVKIVVEERAKSDGLVVVSSAMQGVTDQFIDVCKRAHRGDRSFENVLNEMEERHVKVADLLFSSRAGSRSHRFIWQAFKELREFVHGIWILGELTSRTQDYVMSHGEQLACTMIAEALANAGLAAEYVDSRTLIRTDLTYGSATVNFDLTNWNILNHFKHRSTLPVITGFIACGPDNETTTLGRGGSDYTASIVGAALDATEIEIWTDVDGVMTADPRKVASAFPLEALTFEEAMELSHFGAKVIHPPTMLPALKKRIPIRIRNTFHPAFTGTRISERSSGEAGSPVKGIACIDRMSLLKVTGEGILRTAGIASRVFGALARKNIEVTLVTQSSSEHSMCLAIASEHIRTARETLELEFRVESHQGQISAIAVENDCSVIAVVGERVQNIPGVTGKVFAALGRNGITPRAIAHGSSERNLTLAVRQPDLVKAMNALHDHLFLSRHKTLNLFLVGPGLVGKALLDLLQEQAEYASAVLRTRFILAGLSNSKAMVFDEKGINLLHWRDLLADSKRAANLDEFTGTVRQFNAANSIFIDCTGTEDAVRQYLPLLGASVSVITSSKIANTQDYGFYRQLRSTARENGTQFRYSTNVGTALPIIDSIKSIIHNGDSIERIEAVLSGSLSFISNSVNAGKSFEDAVREARALGYTEPDPRTDLGGTDVARKLMILVREAGHALEMSDLVVEPYMPEEFFSGSDLDGALREASGVVAARVAGAKSRGAALMYTARYADGKARAGLEEIPAGHPFYHLSGNDNIVSLTTRTLYRQPLVIRGGGAGARLTAAGLFNDIVHVSQSMS